MEGIGVSAWDFGNRYVYAETSPLTNAFLNLRYLISRDGNPCDGGVFWETAGKSGDTLLLENKRYLPLGFMVNKELGVYKHDANPFVSQNNLFRLATGVGGDLFTVRNVPNNPYSKKDADGKDTLNWDYVIPADGMFYAYCVFPNEGKAGISFNGEVLQTIENLRPYIFPLGSFSKGDVVTFTTGPGVPRGAVRIMAARIENELFDRGYALLADEALKITEFSGNKISGNITALKDGLLYTSIPDDKNWAAVVDGVNAPIVQVDGCMIALRLSAGTHNVEFRYHNGYLRAGILISLLSLAVFFFLIMRDKVPGELVTYLFFGGATTFVNWCVYGVVVRFAAFSITAGNVTAWVSAVAFAFVTNKIWVFKSRSWRLPLALREAGAFLGARIVSGVVEIAGVPLFYRAGLDYPLLGVEGFAAKVSVSVVVIVLNYVFSKLFIFRQL
jgi:putative flippase GtrA